MGHTPSRGMTFKSKKAGFRLLPVIDPEKLVFYNHLYCRFAAGFQPYHIVA